VFFCLFKTDVGQMNFKEMAFQKVHTLSFNQFFFIFTLRENRQGFFRKKQFIF